MRQKDGGYLTASVGGNVMVGFGGHACECGLNRWGSKVRRGRIPGGDENTRKMKQHTGVFKYLITEGNAEVGKDETARAH